ncbi:hypothetical protein HK104_004429, partial [Borealophlyctis nickersoniae]
MSENARQQQTHAGGAKRKGKKNTFVPLSQFNAKPNVAPHQQMATPSPTQQEQKQPEVESETEDKVCFICAEEITCYAVGQCNHRVCHLCSLRLRALYKNRACAYCKTELPSVVHTRSSTKQFGDFTLSTLPACDKRLSIYFDDLEIHEDALILLRFNCPDPNCDVACSGGWPELKNHVRKTHGMVMCELCTKYKKLFTHEHNLYTPATLARHNREGDPDDPSFRGHPSCGFCRELFYGQDELFEHCRQHHEQCFLCQRNGIRNQYYQNYAELENHFRNDHYLCRHPQCLEKKFVVFATDIDFKAHEMEEHRDPSAKRRGEQIQLNFTYAGFPSRDFEGNDRRGGRR